VVGETGAQDLPNELDEENSSNTVFKLHRLPTAHAAIALRQGNPEKALAILQVVEPYELGQPSPVPLETLYIPYLRGQTFLMEHNGKAAVQEFQKILDHPGIALNSPVGVLAHLEMARAYVMQGDTVRGRAAYADFLTLWKYADPHIPVLKQAKAEYSKLQ
jgi:eukaryotic-like serine/threonine-protein kinase